MTKEVIKSTLKNISDSDSEDTNTVTTFHVNDTEKCFFVRVMVNMTYCGTIYCDCIRIYDDSELIQFINDGKTISIFEYLSIDEISLLCL